MILRPYSPNDRAEIERLYEAQGFAYDFPAIDNPLYFIKNVAEVDGRIVQAGFAHLCAELYFMVDSEWSTPRERYKVFLSMHERGMQQLWDGGIDDAIALLPPQIEKRFGRRLMQLGWRKNLWNCYSRDTAPR